MAAALAAACAPGESPGARAGETWMLVADRDADSILRYDAATGAFIDLVAIGSEIGAAGPSTVRTGPDGLLYVIGFARASVVRYDLAARTPLGVFFQDTSVLEEPVELLFDRDELVVLGNDSRTAVVIARDGTLADVFGYPDLRATHDQLLGPDRMLYIGTDSHPALGTAIQVWDPARGVRVRDFATVDELGSATGIALGPDGLLYACDSFRDQVVRFEPSTGRVDAVLIAGESRQLSAPVSLDFGPGGDLYVVDDLGVAVFSPHTGQLLARLVEVGDGHLVGPRSLTFAPAAP